MPEWPYVTPPEALRGGTLGARLSGLWHLGHKIWGVFYFEFGVADVLMKLKSTLSSSTTLNTELTGLT